MKTDDTFEDVCNIGTGDMVALSEVLLISALDVKSLVVPVRLGLWLVSDELPVTDADTLAGMLLLETDVLWLVPVAAT